MQKKTKWLLAVLLGCLCLTLAAGCSNDNSQTNNTQQLEQKIAELENRLNTGTPGTTTPSTGNTTGTPVVSQAPVAPQAPVASQAPVQTGNYDLTSIQTTTNQMIDKLNSAQPPSDFSQRYSQFRALKAEAKYVDDQIDLLEDQLKLDFKMGQLTYEQYHSLEKQLDLLGDQLDFARDSLKYRFGVDD